MSDFFKLDKSKHLVAAAATAIMIYPNITHIIGYKVPSVFTKSEVGDLDKLKKISSPKDYTLTWWDYGYPIWYYSDTNTLIDGGKHDNDNFIISKIMSTDSQLHAARLARVAVETYVDSNYSIVADTLFHNKQPDQKDPNQVLRQIAEGTYPLHKKTRDIYLYAPLKMKNIFSTVMVFGNLDLNTGNKLRNAIYVPTVAISNKGGMLTFRNGIVFDTKKGILYFRSQKQDTVASFIATQNKYDGSISIQSQMYRMNGRFMVIWQKTFNRFLVMDRETYDSVFVQMFVLGKYDKSLFDLVGPRPDVSGFADRLEGEDRIILDLRPGITGPASLKYKNEEELLAEQADPEKYNREVILMVKIKKLIDANTLPHKILKEIVPDYNPVAN